MSYLLLLKLASPEAVVVATALVLLGLQFVRPLVENVHAPVAVLGLILAAGAVFFLPANACLCNGMLVVTPLTSLFKIIALALAAFTVLLARQPRFTSHRGEYAALILFATVGLMLLIGSEDLLMIFIGLELTGLSLYILAAFDKSSILGIEAGLKYFLFGSTASAFTLFGLSLVYGMCGSTSLGDISHKLASQPVQPLLAAGIAMTLAGFAFKIAAAPFHPWAPDVYQAAPTPSAAFIASGSKVASFFVLGKILLVGFAHIHLGWSPLIAALAALSIIIGNVVALTQRNLRRLLAYSAVAHSGYTLLGLLAGGREGFAATLFYTTIYAFTLVGAFGIVAIVRSEAGGDDISDFSGLRRRSPLLAGCMTVFLLSLAGLPPLAGFFGKFYLFSVAMHTGGNWHLLWLVALALAGSLVSLYYYLGVLKVILVDPPSKAEVHPIKMDEIQRLAVTCLGVMVMLLGLFPDFLNSLITNALL
jgi:NADH-quinone oxidoreductase subunit N